MENEKKKYRLNRYERYYRKAFSIEPYCSWISTALVPLACEMEYVFRKPVEVIDTMNYWSEVILATEDKCLIISPSFPDAPEHAEIIKFYIRDRQGSETPMPYKVSDIVAMMFDREELSAILEDREKKQREIYEKQGVNYQPLKV